MASDLPDAEVKKDEIKKEAGQTDNAEATAAESEETQAAETSDFEDPDDNQKDKLPPIEEFFIKGTEPNVEITESGEQKPLDTPANPDTIRELF